jgi:16S rRNA processing protein RimM
MVVGRVVRPHGLRGEVAVEVLSDAPDRFKPGARMAATPSDQAPDPSAPLQELTVAGSRHQQGRLLVRFAELDGRDRVEHLRGHLLTIPATAARPLEPGEYWPHQLTGLTVTDPDGTVRGTVTDVIAGAAHDLLQVQLTDGRTVLVPCVAALVGVDLDAGRVTVQPLAGLLD